MDEIEGFKQYLGVAEEDRLNYLHPPEKTPALVREISALCDRARCRESLGRTLRRRACGGGRGRRRDGGLVYRQPRHCVQSRRVSPIASAARSQPRWLRLRPHRDRAAAARRAPAAADRPAAAAAAAADRAGSGDEQSNATRPGLRTDVRGRAHRSCRRRDPMGAGKIDLDRRHDAGGADRRAADLHLGCVRAVSS